ncbi:nucleotidyltransferase domain-containing protein [Microlunatus sp. Gsoil 973]|uniref:nucleotidyltransferase domain-containing protein n=1 Tax=Microlunatus sp. Gsoil 973 TaxID=2672569 RepID=UPI0018A837AA|nr:nucleotidyltransferase domain-containing protein [Microlunatus sp. Gsoil 973]
MTLTVEDALAPLPETYHQLYRQVLAVCEPDERIRGLWLSGSLARGNADGGSDLDLLLAVDDDAYETFAAEWQEWLATATPTLLAKRIPAAAVLIVTSLTPQMCRLDVVAERVGALADSPFRTRVAVFDRDGLNAGIPDQVDGPGPDRDKINNLVSEFWRVQSISPAMINDRKDFLVARSGVDLAARLLLDLLIESNQPLPPMGAKRFNSQLTEEQRRILQAVPAYRADPESLVAAGLWLCDAMATHGRAAVERVGAQYPEELAAAVQDHLARTIGRS